MCYDNGVWKFTGRRESTASSTRTCQLDVESDPPKLLVIGPDRSGRLLEVVVLVLADERLMAIHAMPLRAAFYELLPPPQAHND